MLIDTIHARAVPETTASSTSAASDLDSGNPICRLWSSTSHPTAVSALIQTRVGTACLDHAHWAEYDTRYWRPMADVDSAPSVATERITIPGTYCCWTAAMEHCNNQPVHLHESVVTLLQFRRFIKMHLFFICRRLMPCYCWVLILEILLNLHLHFIS